MTRPNFNIVDIVDGGSAEKGQEVFFALKLHDGQEINLFWPYEKFTALIAALMTFAGMTKRERRKLNPSEDRVGNVQGTYAMPVSKITTGTSSDQTTTIVQFHGPQGLSLDVALDPKMLNIAATLLRSLAEESKKGSSRGPKAH
jgi:hypothetical protein